MIEFDEEEETNQAKNANLLEDHHLKTTKKLLKDYLKTS